MKFDENIWDSVDAQEVEDYRQRNFGKYKGMLVYVTRKTRSRFGPKIEVAQKGEFGIVIGEWVSNMGTQKIIFVDHMLRERGTTLKMVKFWGHREQEHAKPWVDTLKCWMDETYVPVLVTRKKKDFKRKGGVFTENDDWVISRDKQSVLVALLGDARKATWLKRDFVHPGDQESLFQSSLKCCSVRVPLWLATKMGAY